ncbi:MAG: DUF1330 domain-containing protein [Hyphomicrobiales bacterium]
MPKGYWIAHVSVTDEKNYPEYIAATNAALAKYGARFLVRGGRHEAPEGPARPRHVVIEFDSFETARACYLSPEYQAAVKLRHAHTESDFVLVEGTG